MRIATSAFLGLVLTLAPAGAETPRKTWAFASLSWVKRTALEPGAPANGQPFPVEAPALARALGSVTLVQGGREEPLFSAKEAEQASRALAEALAAARPDEDLELVSSAKRSEGFLGSVTSVTARVFVRDGSLNLIVHDARLDLPFRYYQMGWMPSYEIGGRARAGDEVLRAGGARQVRPDWVALSLAPAPPPPVAPAPAAQPPASAAPAPAVTSLEDKLRALKRFRDQGLITPAEYERKKQELLKDF